MSNKRITLFTVCFISFTIPVRGQNAEKKMQKHVLEQAIINKLYIDGKWTQSGGTETHLKYLGKIKTQGGQTFKIMNSIWLWGLSHRATSRILIFNNKNQYIGNYYLNSIRDLPTELKNGALIFKNSDVECNKKTQTIVNFRNGIPKQFFRKCNEKSGDIYSFDKE